ncbi:MAG: PEP-CTERM sorting domain-containing protein [Akkermansiaceae bacterium]|nr:PEP-CTERM sorting domain-containing protein [Akkermansiaceae bacterium]
MSTPALAALGTALLLALPGWASEAPVETLPELMAPDGREPVETAAVPEPRSIIFVGLGGLVILAFALRRK